MNAVESPYPPGAVMFPTMLTPRYHEFYDSLDVLHVPEDTIRIRNGGPDCDTNRNNAIRKLPKGVRWVLFIDDDQTFPPDTLMRMLATLYGPTQMDALTGLYSKKVPAFEPILYKHDPNSPFTFDRMTYQELAAKMADGPLVQVAACGAGMLLVKSETLDAVGDPWFNPGPGRAWGGDLGFCGKMHSKGLKLYADLSLGIGHSMQATLTPVFNKGEWYIAVSLGGSPAFNLAVKQFHSVDHHANP